LTKIAGALLISAFALSASADDGEKLVKASDCSSCHAVDHEVVGPSFSAMAKRYAAQDTAVIIEKLGAKIRDGGGGMTPHPDLTDAQRKDMTTWILSLTASAPAQTDAKQYDYKLNDGTTATLDFPLYLEDKAPKVTKSIFHGYQLFNSYCYRCHGTDAAGSQLAPDLRHSLTAGMKQPGFLSVAMTGKKEQGMPAWAGFLTEDDVVDIYRYVKGRSLDLVPSGRPPSGQD
jgi:cytochrome c